MRILLLHPNFPAQFRHVATALGRNPEHRVLFATKNERPDWNIAGVRKVLYTPESEGSPKTHRLAAPFETAILQGEAVFHMAKRLKASGFVPDVIYGHSGWGSTMYLKDVFPDTPLLCYFEWFYDPFGADANFDPVQPGAEKSIGLLRTRNAPILNDLWACDAGFSPTKWQASQFPKIFAHKIHVMHDGVDVNYFKPTPEKKLVLPELDLSHVEELVTYAARGMEPYRGFPQFMEALSLVLARRPKCHAVIAGSERVCYGTAPADGKNYKDIMLERLEMDMERMHFVGSLPYGQYRQVLQASSAHVYLTRPFVLSWSAVEAMSCGCTMVASNTPPVREAITHGKNGLLADFFSPREIAERLNEALSDPERSAKMGQAARETVLERYALQKLLPRHIKLIEDTAQGKMSG
ncbi:MAG: glycosyltransferase [Thermodesulfobacteriota bacterium]|nr:glycosyltransferase [Thermodesulfobacteriota bacterium]